MSNLRRFRELAFEKRRKCIVTSNVQADDVYLRTKYRDLLSDEEFVNDNAGLMAIKFLSILGVSNIFLAGFDGYVYDEKVNYGNQQMALMMKSDILDGINAGMTKVLKMYMKHMDLNFLTVSKYITI